VSYGGVAAGTRAVQQLKPVVTALRMVTVLEAVHVPRHADLIDDGGRFRATEVLDAAARAMLDAVARLSQALLPLRAAVPVSATTA